MTDEPVVAQQIKSITVDEYKAAFSILHEQMAESDLLMLKTHFESPNYDITATQLSRLVGFQNFNTANLRYGLLAGKFCEFFHINTDFKLPILVSFENVKGEWHWILLPKVVQALGELKWFGDSQRLNVLQEIEQFKDSDSYEALQETTRESVIQSRIGQGIFRIELVKYWRVCSVTGCEQIELLRASHIKPWRNSSNAERLDMYNGLLLIPNLDICFDIGLISFDDEGKILISNELNPSSRLLFGINSNLKLSRLEQRHKGFLKYHRENIFRG